MAEYSLTDMDIFTPKVIHIPFFAFHQDLYVPYPKNLSAIFSGLKIYRFLV